MKNEIVDVILGLCGEPLSVQDIAELIGKSETTVRDYVKHLLSEEKLEAIKGDGKKLYKSIAEHTGDAEIIDVETPTEGVSHEPETAAKPAAAPRKAPSEVKVQRGRTRVNLDAKIAYVQGTNPKRSTAAERFELYEVGKTVQDYLNAGGLLRDVPYDVSKGFIKLED